MAMTKTQRALKRKKRLELRIITVTILCLLVVVSFGEMMAQLEEEEQRTQEIEELKKYVQTKKYVEEVAKERLGLVYEDEILFKAVE